MASPHETSAPRAGRTLAWIGALALLVALAVRLGWPGWISFGGEQIDAIALAWRAWHTGIPDHGLRVSVGIDMPPLFVWFLMLPVAATRDPVLVTGAFALANLAGLALAGDALRRAFGARIAWMALLLVAAAPWPVLFSRKIWAQDLLLPFHALFLWTLVRWLERRTRGRAVAGIVALALLLQVYPSAWFLLPPLGVWMLALRVRVPWRDAAIGGALALVLYLPWIRYQVASGFDGFLYALAQRAGDAPAGGEGAGGAWSHAAIDHAALAFDVAGGTRLDLAIGESAHALWRATQPAAALLVAQRGSWVLSALCFLVAVVGAARGAGHVRRGANATLAQLVLALLVLDVVGVVGAYILLGLPATPHYHVVLTLPVALATAWALDAIGRRFVPARPALPFAVAAACALLHAATTAAFLEFVRTRADKVWVIFDPPYQQARDELDPRLALALEEAVHGAALREERLRALERVFEGSERVLLRLDPRDPATAFGAARAVELAGGPDGVAWRLRGRSPWCELADFDLPPDCSILVRIELTAPLEAMVHMPYQTRGRQGWRRGQVIEVQVPAGRSRVLVPFDAPDLLPKLALRLGYHRATIHALEVRAVPR